MWNAFIVLGVNATASHEEVKAAYLAASLKAHPDKGGSAEAFREVKAARDMLLNLLQKSKHLLETQPCALKSVVCIVGLEGQSHLNGQIGEVEPATSGAHRRRHFNTRSV